MRNNYVANLIPVRTFHSKHYLGSGVGVAVLDSGIVPHMDFKENDRSRIAAFVDMVNHYDYMYDDNGHGTQVNGGWHD